jgi:hypothetical protein
VPEVLSPDSKIPAAKTADDINDLFKTIDTEEEVPVKKSTSKEKEEGTEETEESEDEELELKEPEEDLEKLDLTKDDDINIDAPPRKKEIIKEYPEIFKKFPFLEKMMYRDREYTQLFGSFDDAKEVAERAESFNSFETQLLKGDTVEILKSVKDTDEKAFNIIVDDYLPNLAKVDKDAYFHVVGNLNRKLIMEMVQEANETNNDDLKSAALLVNQFVFGTSKFTAPVNKVDRTIKPENDEVEAERLSFVKERFETSRDDLQTRVDNTLKATISDYIDPRAQMSAYIKKNAVADAMKILTDSIGSDSSVVSNLDRLWKAAFDAKFSKDSLNRIQSFYLSKAKGGLKNAILKARAEALKDLAPRAKQEVEEEIEEETPRKRGPIAPGRPSQPKKNEMKKGESVADFFARD